VAVLVNVVLNLWVLLKAGSSLTIRGPVSFSERNLLHVVKLVSWLVNLG